MGIADFPLVPLRRRYAGRTLEAHATSRACRWRTRATSPNDNLLAASIHRGAPGSGRRQVPRNGLVFFRARISRFCLTHHLPIRRIAVPIFAALSLFLGITHQRLYVRRRTTARRGWRAIGWTHRSPARARSIRYWQPGRSWTGGGVARITRTFRPGSRRGSVPHRRPARPPPSHDSRFAATIPIPGDADDERRR